MAGETQKEYLKTPAEKSVKMKQAGNNLIRFIKASGIFFVGNILSKMLSFLMLPLYTSFIPVADMGYFDISITYMNIAVSIVFFEIWSAVLRFMYDKNSNEGKYEVAKSGAIVFSISLIIYSLSFVIIGVSLQIENWYLIAGYGIAQCIVSFYSFFTRGIGKNIDFALSGIISVVVNAGINILLIIIFHIDYVAMYYGFIMGSLAQVLFLETRCHLMKGMRYARTNTTEAATLFKYAIPLCVNTVAYWMMTGFNRIAINWTMGNEANGILSIGNRFGTLITLATTCFTYAWQDVSFSVANNTQARGRFYSTACDLYAKFLYCGALLLIPICHWVFSLMIHNTYANAESTIPLFLLAGVLSAISSFIGNVFYAIKDTKSIFVSTVAAAIVNVVIVFPSIKLFGIDGANIAACIGFLTNILIRVVILRKKIGFCINMIMQIVLIGINVLYWVIFKNINNLSCVLLLIVAIVITIVSFRKEINKQIERYLPPNSFKR